MKLDKDETEFMAILIEQFHHKRQVCDAQEAVEDTSKSNDWLDDVASEIAAKLEEN